MNATCDQVLSYLKSDFNLFQLISSFNTDLARYLHPSYLPEIPHPVVEAILDSPRTANIFSKKILLQFNLADSFHFDFSIQAYRFAILDYQTLHLLALYAGSAIYADEIKIIIQKQKVAELKSFLSDKIYSFAIKRTLLLKKFIPSKNDLIPIPEDIRDRILQAGLNCFEICLSNATSAIIERFKLKFPSSVLWNFNRKVSEDTYQKIFSLLHRILSKEMKSPFASCFN